MEETQSTLQKLTSNERLAAYSKYWFACFALALALPLFGVERVWMLVAPPFLLLFLNAYVHLLLFIQSKKPFMDKRVIAVPKFFLFAGNTIFSLSFFALAVIIFVPNLMEEMGAYLVEPFTTATLITGILIFVACFALTVLGSLLSVVRGQQFWNQIDEDSRD